MPAKKRVSHTGFEATQVTVPVEKKWLFHSTGGPLLRQLKRSSKKLMLKREAPKNGFASLQQRLLAHGA
jgi:hypothetical protein